MKEYKYQVYNRVGSAGSYLTTWDDVVSDLEFNQEINTAGSEVKVTLARNAGDYGEGTDIDFGYNVRIYCFDTENPTGILVFQGFISSYTPIYADNKIEVTILGYGEELNRFMLQHGLELDADGDTHMANSGHGVVDWIRTPWSPSAYYTEWTMTVAAGCIGIQAIDVSYMLHNYDISRTWTLYRGGVEIGSTTQTGTSPFFYWYDSGLSSYMEFEKVTFYPYIEVTPGETLTLRITVAVSDYYEYIFFGHDAYTFPPPYRVWEPSATTTKVEYLSDDPSHILKDILDKYANASGVISYTDDTIDDTGTVVSYTFNGNTTLEGIKKCLELAPSGWYWYVDQATNLLHFHQENNTPDHTFSFENDLIDARFEKRIEDLVNTIYFTGGDIGAGVILYKKYDLTESVLTYGVKAMKYVDQRVTVEGTAETICNAILEKKSVPELRVTLSLLDSSNGNALGYDIESIKVGDVVGVRNVSQTVGLSSWDASRWDADYWDFNIQNLSSLQMQIQKITYSPDKMEIFASTIAVDVNKRIEDINRNLETLQTLNNPDSPA